VEQNTKGEEAFRHLLLPFHQHNWRWQQSADHARADVPGGKPDQHQAKTGKHDLGAGGLSPADPQNPAKGREQKGCAQQAQSNVKAPSQDMFPLAEQGQTIGRPIAGPGSLRRW